MQTYFVNLAFVSSKEKARITTAVEDIFVALSEIMGNSKDITLFS